MNAGLGIWFEPVSFNSFLSEPDKPGTSLSNENFIRIKAIKKGGAADVEGSLRPGDEIFRINGCPINSFGILPPLRPDTRGNVSIIVRRSGKIQKDFHEIFINVFNASLPKPLGKDRPSTSASSRPRTNQIGSPSYEISTSNGRVPNLDLGRIMIDSNISMPKPSPIQQRPSTSGSQSLAIDATKQEMKEQSFTKPNAIFGDDLDETDTTVQIEPDSIARVKSKTANISRARSAPISDPLLQALLVQEALQKNRDDEEAAKKKRDMGVHNATGYISTATARRIYSPNRSRSASPIKGDRTSLEEAKNDVDSMGDKYARKQRSPLRTALAALECHSVFDQIDAERQQTLAAYHTKRDARLISKEQWEEKRMRLRLRKKQEAKKYPAITAAYATSEKYEKGSAFNESKAKSDVEWMIYHASLKPGPGSYSPQMIEKKKGCKFSESRPKSDVEWKIYRASKIPGPADYAATPLPGPSGGKFSTAKPKTFVEWECYRAQQLPGPGEYGAPTLPRPSGGRFSNSKPKTDIDWLVYVAKQLPGPGQYDVNHAKDQPSGGKFNMSNAKSDVEWKMHMASQIPGPADYGAPALSAPSGGKFNESNPKSWVEWQQYRASSIPGPADYPAPSMPKPSGGKFNKSCSKSYIDWEIYKAQQLPGPGQYEPQGPCAHIKSGKISDSKPKSDIDWMIYRASKMPGPGQNDPPKLPQPSGGKFNVADVPGFMDMAAKQGRQSPGAKYNVDKNTMHIYQHHSPSQVQAHELSEHPEQKLLMKI